MNISVKKMEESVQKVVKLLIESKLPRTEKFLLSKKSIKEKYDWLLRYKRTFSKPNVPTEQDIKNVRKYFNTEDELKRLTLEDDQEIHDAFDSLSNMFPSLKDWYEFQKKVSNYNFGLKKEENKKDDGEEEENKEEEENNWPDLQDIANKSLNDLALIHRSSDSSVREKNRENLSKAIKGYIDQTDALLESYYKRDQIISHIPGRKVNKQGAKTQSKAVKELAFRYWDENKENLEDKFDSNQTHIAKELIDKIPKLKASIEIGDYKRDTVRTWVKKEFGSMSESKKHKR